MRLNNSEEIIKRKGIVTFDFKNKENASVFLKIYHEHRSNGKNIPQRQRKVNSVVEFSYPFRQNNTFFMNQLLSYQFIFFKS